jgi:hypothetical protein
MMMASVVEARDHLSGALVATLPTSALPPIGEPSAVGLSRQLRTAFVAAGQLSAGEAESVDFEIRDSEAE